jgi:hypothetical protein
VAAASSSGAAAAGSDRGTLLLIDDLPRVQGGASTDLPAALAQFLASSRYPAVIIASEGEAPGEPATKPALARVLGRDVLAHTSATFMAVNPVADTRMRKVLADIAAREGVASVPTPDGRGGVDALPVGTLIERIIESARGDVRHAINSLQFACTVGGRAAAAGAAAGGSGGGRGRAASASASIRRPLDGGGGGGGGGQKKRRMRDIDADAGDAYVDGASGGSSRWAHEVCGRDDFLDALHALGKLLHAKRRPREAPVAAASAAAPAGGGGRGELEYDPDTVMAGCPYDAATTGAFLLENGPAFFTDVGQLAAALETLSTADVLSAHAVAGGGRARWTGGRGAGGGGGTAAAGTAQAAVFPEQYAAALTSRAVSTFNASPAPSSFRPTRKPQLFAVARVRDANATWLREECLGMGPDVGIEQLGWADAAGGTGGAGGGEAAQPSAPVAMVPPSERATTVVPLAAVIVRAHAQRAATGARGGSQPADIAATVTAATGFTHREYRGKRECARIE